MSVSGLRIKAECCLTGRAEDVLFVGDIIANLATKLSANLATADGVMYSSDTR